MYRLYYGEHSLGSFDKEELLMILHINNVQFTINDDDEFLFPDENFWVEKNL